MKKQDLIQKGVSGALSGLLLFSSAAAVLPTVVHAEETTPGSSIVQPHETTGQEDVTKPGTTNPDPSAPGTTNPDPSAPGTTAPDPTPTPDPEPTPTPEPEPTPSYPSELSMNASIKKNATADSVKSAILSQFKNDNSAYPIKSINWTGSEDFTSDGSISVEYSYDNDTNGTLTISTSIVNPTGWAFKNPSLATLKATSTENQSNSSLLQYVNKDLSLVLVGDSAYENAIGTVTASATAKAFTWKDSDTAYNAAGGVTYKFTTTYEDSTLTKTLRVDSASNNISDLDIDYSDNTVNTQSGMKWSLRRNDDKSKWSSCSANMKIPNTWYDKTVYFYMPATKYAEASNVVSLYIPPKADKPTEKLELTSTTHSITVGNCWDYGDVEFSINKGDTWKTTKNGELTFTNLDSNTSYTVSVRVKADRGHNLASDALTASIKTKETVITGIDVKTNGNVITATATIEPDNSKNMSASMTTTMFTKLNNAYKSVNQKYSSPEATLRINHLPEADLEDDILSTRLTLPMSELNTLINHADLSIEYKTDMGSILLSNSMLDRLYSKNATLTLYMQKLNNAPSGTNMKWLKDQYNDGCPVYKLYATAGSKTTDIEYSIPYTISKKESVAGINVYEVNSKGEKTNLGATYDADRRAVRFTSDNKDAYFVIVNEGLKNVDPNFRDVPSWHWAHDYVKVCYNRGIMVGTSSNTFSPDGKVTKAQIVTMLARMDGLDTSASVSNTHFSDVKTNDWYAAAAAWSYEKGICSGSFKGDEPVQRQEIAYLMYQYLTKVEKYDGKVDSKYTADFADQKQIDSKYRTAALFLKEKTIMLGYGNNYFGPKDYVTRAQMATVTERMYSTLKL